MGVGEKDKGFAKSDLHMASREMGDIARTGLGPRGEFSLKEELNGLITGQGCGAQITLLLKSHTQFVQSENFPVALTEPGKSMWKKSVTPYARAFDGSA